MPWPTHFRFVFRGDFSGTPEHWSFGCHFNKSVDGGGDAGYSNIDDDAVTTAISVYLNSVSASNVVLTDWRVYDVQSNGKLPENGQPMLRIPTPGSVHGGGQAIHVPQVALKVTTVALNRGPASKGGWFIPGPRNAFDPNDSRLTAAMARDVVAANSSAFLKALSSAIDLPNTIGSSAALNVSQGPPGSPNGTRQDVHHVEVGRVFDTIRNRRKSLVEDRQADSPIDW